MRHIGIKCNQEISQYRNIVIPLYYNVTLLLDKYLMKIRKQGLTVHG